MEDFLEKEINVGDRVVYAKVILQASGFPTRKIIYNIATVYALTKRRVRISGETFKGTTIISPEKLIVIKKYAPIV